MPKFNVKTTDNKTIEVEGKLVKSSNPPKIPEWFSMWSHSFEKKIDKKFNKIDERLDHLENRFDNLVAKNNLQE